MQTFQAKFRNQHSKILVSVGGEKPPKENEKNEKCIYEIIFWVTRTREQRRLRERAGSGNGRSGIRVRDRARVRIRIREVVEGEPSGLVLGFLGGFGERGGVEGLVVDEDGGREGRVVVEALLCGRVFRQTP